MAVVVIQNGQEMTPTTETEIRLPANPADRTTYVAISREIKFRVTTGTVKVTTAKAGIASGVTAGAQIHAYATGEPDFMTVEPAEGRPGEGTSMYVQGTGTIVFSF